MKLNINGKFFEKFLRTFKKRRKQSLRYYYRVIVIPVIKGYDPELGTILEELEGGESDLSDAETDRERRVSSNDKRLVLNYRRDSDFQNQDDG